MLSQENIDSTTDACSAYPAGTDFSGKVVVVRRGTCTFTVKAQNGRFSGEGERKDLCGLELIVFSPSPVLKAGGDLILFYNVS